MRLPALLLDVDGTLVNTAAAEQEAADALVASEPCLHDVDPAGFLPVWRRERSSARLDGTIPLAVLRRERMSAVLDHFGVAEPAQRAHVLATRFAELTLACCRAYPDVAVLRELSLRYELGVITNGDPDHQRAKLRVAQIETAFAVFVASMDVGACKPDAAPFLTAARLLARDPRDCIYVGDSVRNDVEGASNSGMMAALVDRKWRSTTDRPCTRIRTLDELPALLATLARPANP